MKNVSRVTSVLTAAALLCATVTPSYAQDPTPPATTPAPVASGNDTVTVITSIVALITTTVQFNQLRSQGRAARLAPAIADRIRYPYPGGESSATLTRFNQQLYISMSQRRPVIGFVPPSGQGTALSGITATSLRTRAPAERDVSTIFAWAQMTADEAGAPPQVLVCEDGLFPVALFPILNALFTALAPAALNYAKTQLANRMRDEFTTAARPYRIRVFIPEDTPTDRYETTDVVRVEFVHWPANQAFDCRSGNG